MTEYGDLGTEVGGDTDPAAAPASATRTARSAKPEKDTSLVRWLIETVLLVLLAFALAQGIKTFLVQPFVIPTGSMIPTIEIGDRVLADKLVFRFFRDPQRGDIVVFDDPNGQHPQLIKRVIAIEGETVDIRDGMVYVNDQPLDEPYTHSNPTDPGSVSVPLIVPEGHVWLMGDNRPESGDSRFFDARPIDTVRGRAFWTYWPIGRFGSLE